VVQPNFEVVVYSEKSGPEILHMLGSFADLVSDQESLVYRMSLNSIYRAAESSLTYKDIDSHLEKHSITEIPPNVSATLKEWWDRCNQVCFFPQADLIELSDTEPFEKLPDTFRKCSLRSGNFLVFGNPLSNHSSFIEVVDHRKRGKCCKLTEDGNLTVDRRKADFFLISDLRRITVAGAETANELHMRLDFDKVKEFRSQENQTALELLKDICDAIPSKLAVMLLTSFEELPCATFSPLVALSLPRRIVEEGLAEQLLAGISLGKVEDSWLLSEEKFQEIRVELTRLGIRLDHNRTFAVENGKGASKNGAVKPPVDRQFTAEEKLRIINKAIEGNLEIELLYSLQGGTKRMVVQPTHIMTSTGDSVIEARDRLNGMTVMLTASNIASIRRVIRRGGQR
jgi:hypothetical protein